MLEDVNITRNADKTVQITQIEITQENISLKLGGFFEEYYNSFKEDERSDINKIIIEIFKSSNKESFKQQCHKLINMIVGKFPTSFNSHPPADSDVIKVLHTSYGLSETGDRDEALLAKNENWVNDVNSPPFYFLWEIVKCMVINFSNEN